MIESHWLEPPTSRTNFHGPKDVRAIEVWLYKSIFRLTQIGYIRIIDDVLLAEISLKN